MSAWHQTAVIAATAEALLTDEATASLGRRLKEAADEPAGTAEKDREIDEQIIAREPAPESITIGEIVEQILDDQAFDDEGAVTVSADDDHELVTDRPALVGALTELVESALQHGGESPEVAIVIEAADRVGYEVQVRVADEGPGIPGQELGPIRAEQETDLEHTSGIGLWKVKWCVDRLDGDVQFETPEGGGTTVRL